MLNPRKLGSLAFANARQLAQIRIQPSAVRTPATRDAHVHPKGICLKMADVLRLSNVHSNLLVHSVGAAAHSPTKLPRVQQHEYSADATPPEESGHGPFSCSATGATYELTF